MALSAFIFRVHVLQAHWRVPVEYVLEAQVVQYFKLRYTYTGVLGLFLQIKYAVLLPMGHVRPLRVQVAAGVVNCLMLHLGVALAPAIIVMHTLGRHTCCVVFPLRGGLVGEILEA